MSLKPILNSKSTNLFTKFNFTMFYKVFLLKYFLKSIWISIKNLEVLWRNKKTINILCKKLVDSEFKIGCWHVMNLLRTKSVTFFVGISNGLHSELKMISSDLTADRYLAENLNEFVTFLASFKVGKFFIFQDLSITA